MTKMQEAWEAHCKKHNLHVEWNPDYRHKFEAGYQAAIAELGKQEPVALGHKHMGRYIAIGIKDLMENQPKHIHERWLSGDKLYLHPALETEDEIERMRRLV